MIYIFYLLGYGFLLTAGLGLLASWFDRKITARFQYRVGPPLAQPLLDIVKLFGKETLIPQEAHTFVFLAAPIAGMAGAAAASTFIWINNIAPVYGFTGDLVAVIYFLMIPSLSLIIAGFASSNPLASLGSSREMKLVLSYEFPFILTAIVAVIKSGFSITLSGIIAAQSNNGFNASGISGLLAFAAAILCAQAKLGLAPFDIAEAETEIASGPLIEYSGAPLGMFRLTKIMLLLVMPFLLITLFWGGLEFKGLSLLYGAAKYIFIIFIFTVIRNINPRVKIDQAMRFFWGPVTLMAILAIALALSGY